MTPERQKAEALIYKTFDALDPTGSNTKFWKELFSGMSDDEFKKFTARTMPYRLQTSAFRYEPSTQNIIDTFKVLNIPLLEDVYHPYLYEDSNGKAVTCSKAIIGYVNLVAMKQMLAKKNNYGVDNSSRESKTGRLTGHDKGGLVSDREMESFILFNQDKCVDLFSHEMADDMDAKAQMLTQISTTGQYKQSEVKRESKNQISKNTVDAYLIGSHLYTNLINSEYMTPYTLSEKSRRVERESE